MAKGCFGPRAESIGEHNLYQSFSVSSNKNKHRKKVMVRLGKGSPVLLWSKLPIILHQESWTQTPALAST